MCVCVRACIWMCVCTYVRRRMCVFIGVAKCWFVNINENLINLIEWLSPCWIICLESDGNAKLTLFFHFFSNYFRIFSRVLWLVKIQCDKYGSNKCAFDGCDAFELDCSICGCYCCCRRRRHRRRRRYYYYKRNDRFNDGTFVHRSPTPNLIHTIIMLIFLSLKKTVVTLNSG